MLTGPICTIKDVRKITKLRHNIFNKINQVESCGIVARGVFDVVTDSSFVCVTGLFHAVDWYPTLVTAAGGSPPAGQDGIAMWQELLTNTPTPTSRDEFVYNIDDKNRR